MRDTKNDDPQFLFFLPHHVHPISRLDSCSDDPDLSTCTTNCTSNCRCDVGFAGNATLNQCTACSPGFYADEVGLSACKPCSCPQNMFSAGCGGSTPGVCVACASCPSGYVRVNCTGTNQGVCALAVRDCSRSRVVRLRRGLEKRALSSTFLFVCF